MSLSRREIMRGLGGLALARGALAPPAAAENEVTDDNVVELRQYTLRGGQRDTLIGLFEREFVDPQNALGAHVVGTFRDLDDPDRFVWIRAFKNMDSRQKALTSFYGGPVWLANRSAANATIVDSDNVLLLRPEAAGTGFPKSPGKPTGSDSLIGAAIYYLGTVDPAQFVKAFEESIRPHLAALGVQPIARLVSLEATNNFPRLPIREADRVFVWFDRWPDAAAQEEFVAKLAVSSGWRNSIPESVLPAFMRKPERLRLAPTARSELR